MQELYESDDSDGATIPWGQGPRRWCPNECDLQWAFDMSPLQTTLGQTLSLSPFPPSFGTYEGLTCYFTFSTPAEICYEEVNQAALYFKPIAFIAKLYLKTTLHSLLYKTVCTR